uniref:DUF4806 domain-containing protein n=1 Tax=Macrostomum lignano TaxID=282301 RepID=A0A1I8GQE6_9PLAT
MSSAGIRFIIFFMDDGQILEKSEEELTLGHYQGFTSDDWRAMDEARMYEPTRMEVRAEYGEEWYSAIILQVVLDPETDSAPTIHHLRRMRIEKKKTLDSLLKAIRRVNCGQRNRISPIDNMPTSEESEKDQEGDCTLTSSTPLDTPSALRPTLPSLPMSTLRSTPLSTPSGMRPTLSSMPTLMQRPFRQLVSNESRAVSEASGSGHGAYEPPSTVSKSTEQDRPEGGAASSGLGFHPSALRDIPAQLIGLGLRSGVHVACETHEAVKTLQRELSTIIEGLSAQVAVLNRRMQVQPQHGAVVADSTRRDNFRPINSWPDYIRFITSRAERSNLAPSLLGCRAASTHDTVKRMLNKCLSPELQCLVNWSGRNMARRLLDEHPDFQVTDSFLAFRNALDVFLEAIIALYPEEARRPSEYDVKKTLKDLLKHAAERQAARRRRTLEPREAGAARQEGIQQQAVAAQGHRQRAAGRQQRQTGCRGPASKYPRVSSSDSSSD